MWDAFERLGDRDIQHESIVSSHFSMVSKNLAPDLWVYLHTSTPHTSRLFSKSDNVGHIYDASEPQNTHRSTFRPFPHVPKTSHLSSKNLTSVLQKAHTCPLRHLTPHTSHPHTIYRSQASGTHLRSFWTTF